MIRVLDELKWLQEVNYFRLKSTSLLRITDDRTAKKKHNEDNSNNNKNDRGSGVENEIK